MTTFSRHYRSTLTRIMPHGRRLTAFTSLCLVLIAGLAALILVQDFQRQLSDVVRTYEIQRQARDLATALVEAESSQRGYLLTFDEAYLAPYQRAVDAAESRLAALEVLVDGDMDRAERVEAISGEIDRRRSEMDASLTLVSSNRPDQAQSLMQSGAGVRLMDELRETLSLFVADEDLYLLDRNRVIERSRLGLTAAVLAALIGAAVLAYVLLTRTQRQVSDLAQRQDALLTANEALEAAVAERTAALEVARAYADNERQRVETMLQDTNHRIGNSLATVSSLLALQVMRSRSDDVRAALEAARDRVHAIASGHRRLRLGPDLETVAAAEFLDAVLHDLATTLAEGRPIEVVGEFEPVTIRARDATTIGILLGELVTNALKHAFPDGRAGTIRARFGIDDRGAPFLSVEDNGVGLPPPSDDGGNETPASGLGSVIVTQLARQFGGVATPESAVGAGTEFRVTLPELAVNPEPETVRNH